MPQANLTQQSVTTSKSSNGDQTRLSPSTRQTAEHLYADRIDKIKQIFRFEQSIAKMPKSDDACLLLVLLCFLDVSVIAKGVLKRAGITRKCWNELGEVEEVLPSQSGLCAGLLEVICSEAKLDEAIAALATTSLLSVNAASGDMSLSMQTRDHTLGLLDSDTKSYWKSQALLLICHGFPRDKYLEPR